MDFIVKFKSLIDLSMKIVCHSEGDIPLLIILSGLFAILRETYLIICHSEGKIISLFVILRETYRQGYNTKEVRLREGD